MKLRLTLKTTTKNGKDAIIKFNIAPSKHLGFINFMNLAINQEKDVDISFEKISKGGQRELGKFSGSFKFEAVEKDAKKELKELEEDIQDNKLKKKKIQQKRKSK